MSNAPHLIMGMRKGVSYGNAKIVDSMICDGLWDPYGDFHMGMAGEMCSSKYNLSREQQDEFALSSYKKARQAIDKKEFEQEITPIKVKNRKSEVDFKVDEEPLRLKEEKVKTLRPAFKKDGTITAANASSVNDGAAMLLLCSEDAVKKYKLKPKAIIISQGTHSQEPEWFTTAPVGAINNALSSAELKEKDISFFEVNEAFSSVAMACASDLKIPSEKLNIRGGAVALGHPIGASGARILVTLLYTMIDKNERYGCAGLCNGGGEASALVIEKV